MTTVFLVMEVAEYDGESSEPRAVYASRELAENAIGSTLMGPAMFEIKEFVVRQDSSTMSEEMLNGR